MALIKNPVTIVQGVEDSAEYEEQANDYGTTAIIYGYTTEENSYGQTAITKKRGMPEDYPGPYTVTENGIVSCNSKRMTSDLTVNVEPELQSKEVVPSDSTDMLVGPDNGYYGLSMVTVKKINTYELTLLNSYIKQVVNAGSPKLFSPPTNGYYKYVWLYPIAIDAADIKKGAEILGVTGTYESSGELQEKTVNPTEEVQAVTPDADYYGLLKVTVEAIKTQNYTITPSREEQIVSASGGRYIKQVTVNPVTAGIDSNIVPENIRKDVTILGVTGTVSATAPVLQEKTVTENGEVTPDEGYDGLSKVTVNVGAQTPQEFTATLSETEDYVYEVPDNVRITKITIPKIKASDITNLEAKNIAYGVKILGITGTHESRVVEANLDELRLSKATIINSSGSLAYYASNYRLDGFNRVLIQDDGGGT